MSLPTEIPFDKDSSYNLESDSKGSRITINMNSPDGTIVQIKNIRKTGPLGKSIVAFCTRKNLDPRKLRFLFNGKRIWDDSTPLKLGMKDESFIDVMQLQDGGMRTRWLC